MIQPLRVIHRRAFVALAVVLPAILLIGLEARRPGQDAAGPDQESQGNGQSGQGKVTQDDTMKLEYPATHTFPD